MVDRVVREHRRNRVVAHAGSAAVRLLADRVGLTSALSQAVARRSFTPVHDRGRVLVDLAVLLADGGEAIADIDVLRHQSDLREPALQAQGETTCLPDQGVGGGPWRERTWVGGRALAPRAAGARGPRRSGGPGAVCATRLPALGSRAAPAGIVPPVIRPTPVALAALADVPDGGALDVSAAVGSPAYLVRRGSAVRLLAATCTHASCTVAWRPAARRFACPCHRGEYDQKGAVTNGPPPRALDELPVTVVDGQVRPA